MEKRLAFINQMDVLGRALTALRYAAREFEELREFDNAAMMEMQADDLAKEICAIRTNAEEDQTWKS